MRKHYDGSIYNSTVGAFALQKDKLTVIHTNRGELSDEDPLMTIDEFWKLIESCRAGTGDLPTFNREMALRLAALELVELASFDQILWSELGVYNDHELWAIIDPDNKVISGDDSWEAYGGWLVAQGRDYYESVMGNPQKATSRLPTHDDIVEGEGFIFAAQNACQSQTGASLYDHFPELFS